MSDHQGSLLYLTNPELAIALRRRQMGEQLLQQGTDASPIRNPWQGAARLAQALIGGYDLHKSDQAVDDYAKKGQADFAAALSRNNEMIGGGARPDAPPAAPAMPSGGAAMPPLGSSELMGMVAPRALDRGVPLSLAMALFQQESGGRPGAVGDGGKSVGLGQIQEATARAPGYGVAPMDPARRGDPGANIDFALDYLKGKGAAMGATDLSDPAHQAVALRAYNGGGDPNYVQNVQGRMGQGAPPTAPPTGAAAPQVQQAMRLMDEGQRNSMSFDPRLKALGQSQMQRAQFLMSLDTYQNTPDGGQVNVRTGKREYPPTPRMATDSQGNLIAVKPGGETSVVSPGGANPGVNAKANATRVLQSFPPDSPEYRDAYAELYGERTEMGPSGPVTYRPSAPPAGLAPPIIQGAPAPQAPAGGGGGAGVTYAAPVQPNAPLARKINVPLADSNPYEGMSAAEQQKAKTENVRAVRERFAKRDETDAKTDEMIAGLQRFKELNKAESTGPAYGLPIVGGALRAGARFTPAFQEMEAIAANIAPNMRVAGSGASSDADVALFKNATVSIDKPAAVNRNIADAHIMAAQNKKDFQAFTQAFVEANGHEQGAERMWNKYLQANPIFDPEKKDTYGLNTARVGWQQWFQNAIDPQTGRMKDMEAPSGGVMRFDKSGNLINGR